MTDRHVSDGAFPPFHPHPWVRGGHAQTILGRYLPGPRDLPDAVGFEVGTDGGDRLWVLESIPDGWGRGDPSAILVHGLGGCANAPYVTRVASRLLRLGIRVIRMNLRGAGAGFGIARGFYHAGCTADLRRVADWQSARAPGSPLALVGFSLGANLVLKLAAEAASDPVAGLDCVLAANPPVDLAACCRHLRRFQARIYDRNFVKYLRAEVARLHRTFPELGPVGLSRVGSVFEFDDLYTAPRNGFVDALDYYRRSSSGPLITRIEIPGLVVHAADDPFIPVESIRGVTFPPGLALELNRHGGHLGYFSRQRLDGDRRWLDARFAAWLARRWGRSVRPRSASRLAEGTP